jgi:hypothetical protein
MADPAPVHLSVPFRRGPDGHLAEDAQDSPEEIGACLFAIANTRPGDRDDLPEFGTPGQAFQRNGADLGQIERALALWEPRASVEALRNSGYLRELAEGVDRVTVEERIA